MKRSTERILVTHAGSLPRPDDLWKMFVPRDDKKPYDKEAFEKRLKSAVSEGVQKQVESGIDSVNDGELGKTNFSRYVFERLSGFEARDPKPGSRTSMIFGRDMADFPEYLGKLGEITRGRHSRPYFCIEPLTYIGRDFLRTDIANFKEALRGVKVEDAFLPAVAPGTIEHRMKNDYYPNDEAYLYGIADAMHEEYKAIVDAGFTLQIDDPDLADGWQINHDMSLAEYRRFAELRIDALNHGLRDIPEEKIRFHMCWGSYNGPHKYDIPLKDIVDIILKVRATVYSIEASNPCHEHEWRVWEEVKFPEGKVLIPGVVGHYSDFIEHPELVAERLVKFAKLVGRENVMADTDCGLGTRVGHPQIVWAKFKAMAEGAALATKQLW